MLRGSSCLRSLDKKEVRGWLRGAGGRCHLPTRIRVPGNNITLAGSKRVKDRCTACWQQGGNTRGRPRWRVATSSWHLTTAPPPPKILASLRQFFCKTKKKACLLLYKLFKYWVCGCELLFHIELVSLQASSESTTGVFFLVCWRGESHDTYHAQSQSRL